MISEMTVNAKTNWIDFQKTSSNGATSVAGRWHEMLTWTGVPSALSFSGSAGAGTQLTASTTGAFPQYEGNVSTDLRFLLNLMAYTPSSTVTPASLLICDMLLYYPALVVTGTPTTMSGSGLSRYTDGKGVRAFCAVQSAIGVASPALTFTYAADDSSSQTAVMTAAANSQPISACFPNNGGVFFPVPAGKLGVKSLTSYTIASGTSGTVAVVLCKPLIQIPLCAQYQSSERECLNQFPSLPQIQDGACLGGLVMVGGAMTTLQTVLGRLQYCWG